MSKILDTMQSEGQQVIDEGIAQSAESYRRRYGKWLRIPTLARRSYVPGLSYEYE